MLEDKTANNVITRYHRILMGDQNQLEAGGSNDFSIASITINVSGDDLYMSLPIALTTPQGNYSTAPAKIPAGTAETVQVILYDGTCGATFDDSAWTCEVTGDIEVDYDTILIHGDGTLSFTATIS